ncbi:heterokaryon incompatibility protein-domain-containing protein [Dichomitus squalens]|uniref:Heterokaryon incompatibility protein-domain-containing protein n=1 Tax=Dichomitus squalens TaxID=114155 RepID=A0A4Q9MPA3_9APHY|nr:heterokaryon incompatibility protein-domain-containing protein [Dichomitus squalens]
MWLLSTDRAELHHFISPQHLSDGYAILSHVWGKKEQSFQETPAYHKDLPSNRPNARDTASEKVRQCCILAERDGLRWIWNDTCCIDKTSSADLSEAINSMYLYYSLAEVCYAYLADVAQDRFDTGTKGLFAASQWHTRGWTLQELIASPFLVLISSDWQKLGTKMDHARSLSEITHIPVEVLLMQKPVSSFSVAQRMSWACGRKTTRVEDRAYSLMGIFSVNMTAIYGEGERAFRRLQEEIMRQSIDPSLFAWGDFSDWQDFQGFNTSTSETETGGGSHMHNSYTSYLLARSPDDFAPNASGKITFRRETSQIASVKKRTSLALNTHDVPTFAATPYGCLSRLVCVQLGHITLASLACQWDQTPRSEQLSLWLVLQRCADTSLDNLGPLYHTGSQRLGAVSRRIVGIPENLHPWKRQKIRQQEIHIALWHTTPKDTSPPIPVALEHKRFQTPFHITHDALRNTFLEPWRLHHAPPVPYNWPGTPPIAFHFIRDDLRIGVQFIIGLCLTEPGQHFASFHFYRSDLIPAQDDLLAAHDCRWDHISKWPEGLQGQGSRTWIPCQYIRITDL